jgi:hypothetical protein
MCDGCIVVGLKAAKRFVDGALSKLHSLPGESEHEKWKKAFGAQSRKLKAVLHIPGVREALNEVATTSPAGAGKGR